MPNNIIYDKEKRTIYIEVGEANQHFIIHASGKLNDLDISTVMIDARGLQISPDGLTLLIETAKTKSDVIVLIDSKTNPELSAALLSISTGAINYDQIPFKSDEEKRVFEDLIIDKLDSLCPNRTERLNIVTEREYLNAVAKEHLKAIIKDYASVLNEERKAELSKLLDQDMIVVEVNHDAYTARKESLGEKEEPKDYPTAHGGKVFGDGKIHFYLNKFSGEDISTMEGVLIHELFHYLINPTYSQKHPEVLNLNSNIAEGLVDMSALDYMTQKGLFDGYHSNYPSYVIFVREKLNTLPDEESKKMLVVNGSIEQFIEATSKTEEDFIKDYQAAANHETDFDKAVDIIAGYDPAQRDGYTRSCMRLGARLGPNKALQTISETISELTPEQLGLPPEEAAKMKQGITEIVNSYSPSLTM